MHAHKKIYTHTDIYTHTLNEYTHRTGGGATVSPERLPPPFQWFALQEEGSGQSGVFPGAASKRRIHHGDQLLHTK
jgi:hypothetical protein